MVTNHLEHRLAEMAETRLVQRARPRLLARARVDFDPTVIRAWEWAPRTVHGRVVPRLMRMPAVLLDTEIAEEWRALEAQYRAWQLATGNA